MWLKRSESFRPGDHNISRRVTPTSKTDVLQYRNGLRVMNALLITVKGGRGFERNIMCVPRMLAQLAGPKASKSRPQTSSASCLVMFYGLEPKVNVCLMLEFPHSLCSRGCQIDNCSSVSTLGYI